MIRPRFALLSLSLSLSLALPACLDTDRTEVATAAAELGMDDCLGQKFFDATLPDLVAWNGTLPQGVTDAHVWVVMPTDASATNYELWLVDPDNAKIPWAAKVSPADLGPVLAKILDGAGQTDAVRPPTTGPGPRGTEFAIFLLEYARRLREAHWNAAVVAGLKP